MWLHRFHMLVDGGARLDDTALALLMAEHAKVKALTETPAEA